MTDKTRYFCWVKKHDAPKVPHHTLDDATAEAHRLRERFPYNDVHVMSTVLILDGLPEPEIAPSGRKILRLSKSDA